LEETTQLIDRTMLIEILAALGVAYLFFCYCCMLICQKAGSQPGIWVWIPLIQFIPLFRAAGMSAWNFLLMWLPLVGFIVLVIFCFKICRARNKSSLLGLMLLLPVINILAFLFLAFSDGQEVEERPVAKLQFS
jgi:hypothetical protein